MVERSAHRARSGETSWLGLRGEYTAYIEMSLEPEIQRIMLLDGPAVLGDPSQWPSQNACLRDTTADHPGADRRRHGQAPVDAEAAARLLNGATLSAALWIAAENDPHPYLAKVIEAFRCLAGGLLKTES